MLKPTDIAHRTRKISNATVWGLIALLASLATAPAWAASYQLIGGGVVDPIQITFGGPHYYAGPNLEPSVDLSFFDEDLSYAVLTNADLAGLGFAYNFMIGVELGGADLSNAYLEGVEFQQANLSGANLSGADLSFVSASEIDLSGANLSGATLVGASLGGAMLQGADMTGADLSFANLSGAGGQLAAPPSILPTGFVVANNYLVGPNIDLNGVDLSGTDLSAADLTDVRGQLAGAPSTLPAGYIVANNFIEQTRKFTCLKINQIVSSFKLIQFF